jgi:hypothetical protein
VAVAMAAASAAKAAVAVDLAAAVAVADSDMLAGFRSHVGSPESRRRGHLRKAMFDFGCQSCCVR